MWTYTQKQSNAPHSTGPSQSSLLILVSTRLSTRAPRGIISLLIPRANMDGVDKNERPGLQFRYADTGPALEDVHTYRHISIPVSPVPESSQRCLKWHGLISSLICLHYLCTCGLSDNKWGRFIFSCDCSDFEKQGDPRFPFNLSSRPSLARWHAPEL